MIEQRQKVVINKQVVGISQLLESLERGDIDMAISGITITDRRREVFDFSLPYYDATQTILSLQTKSNLDSLGVLVNAKVGVINNSTSLIFAEETLIRRHYLAIGNLVRYQNLSALTNALKNYDIDYIILEHTRGAIIQQQFGLSIVYRNEVEEKFAIAYQPSFPSAKSLNRTIERILRSEDWKKVLMKFEI
jgi:ABC-type amino acid transport substrate-binding protein